MKKILFNGERFVDNQYYGTVRHSYELLLALDKIVPQGKYTILVPKCKLDKTLFKNIRIKTLGFISKKNPKMEKTTKAFWKYIVFPFYSIFTRSITINTFPAWGFFSFDAINIYDCTPVRFYKKDKYASQINLWNDRLIKNEQKSANNARVVLTDSENAKADIVEIYHVSPDKVKVIPCAWQHFERVQEDAVIINKLGLEGKEYFFSLGSRLPHKNIKWVTMAANKHPQYVFVVTGAKQVVSDTSFEGDIPDNMIFTGYLSDEEIKALMRHCKAFIQPSFYEGFGIPPMEAMSVGADCIVSNASSLPEVYKNSVWYIDPYDYDNIDLDMIMAQEKEGNEIILQEYSWDKSARILLSIIENLASIK